VSPFVVQLAPLLGLSAFETSVAVTRYSVMAEPLVELGGLQTAVADLSPARALMPIGALGTPPGVTEFEVPDASLEPTPFVAVAVKR
jgi:hypothetical protein